MNYTHQAILGLPVKGWVHLDTIECLQIPQANTLHRKRRGNVSGWLLLLSCLKKWRLTCGDSLHKVRSHMSHSVKMNIYRPRSRGDNMFGSLRPSVHPSVCASQGAFKMVWRSKWLLFRQVVPSRSITLLIWSISVLKKHLLRVMCSCRGVERSWF